MAKSIAQSVSLPTILFSWCNNSFRSWTACGSHSPTHIPDHQLLSLKQHRFPLDLHQCQEQKEPLTLEISIQVLCTGLLLIGQKPFDSLRSIEISSLGPSDCAEGQQWWQSLLQNAYSNWLCPRTTVRLSLFRAQASHSLH